MAAENGHFAGGSSMREERVYRLIELWNRADVERLVAESDIEIEWLLPRSAREQERYEGPAGVRRAMGDVALAWETAELELMELHEVGDSLVGLGRMTGRSRDAGTELRISLGWVWDFTGDRLVRMRSYPSPEGAIEAVGGLPRGGG
jgi:ketosteroid isomerase-like protein